MKELTKVDIDNLKVGDEVGLCRHPEFGWNRRFRYPIISKRRVLRITPKRTKFVLSGNIELDVKRAKELVVCDAVAMKQSEIAKMFSDLASIQYEIDEAKRNGVYVFASKVTDEELIEHYRFMKSIHEKYIKKKE